MFWNPREVSTLTQTFNEPKLNQFNLDLINCLVPPLFVSEHNKVHLELSQLVWKYTYFMMPSSWRIENNP